MLLAVMATNQYVINLKALATKYWICDSKYVDNDVKVRDHCYITGKYKGSLHIEIVILKLN